MMSWLGQFAILDIQLSYRAFALSLFIIQDTFYRFMDFPDFARHF